MQVKNMKQPTMFLLFQGGDEFAKGGKQYMQLTIILIIDYFDNQFNLILKNLHILRVFHLTT